MPVDFQLYRERNHFISTWSGSMTDHEMMSAYRSFYEGEEWVPGMHELVDLSAMDFSRITSQGLSSLASYTKSVFERRGIEHAKAAVFCGTDLQYGMVRAYDAWAHDSPESVRVFRSREEAEAWLLEDDAATG